jgi:GNAT superfamily N-acetyltransferase
VVLVTPARLAGCWQTAVMSPVQRIERVDEHGWRSLRELRLTALQADPSAFGSTLERELDFPEDRWRNWARTRACFLAWSADGGVDLPIGMAVGKDRCEGVEAELVALWVDPEHRGMAVGAALVSAVVEWARADGRRRLNLWVVPGNDAAIGLYERLGFVPTGAAQPLPSDSQQTEVEYALPLR